MNAREVVLNAIGDTLDELSMGGVVRATDAVIAALAAAGLEIVPRERLLTAFVGGFGVSGEGYNGEYPGDITRDGLAPMFDAWLTANKLHDEGKQ